MCCSVIVCIRVWRLASHSLVVVEVVANITDTQTDRRRDWPCNARARLQGWSGLTQLVVNLIRSKIVINTTSLNTSTTSPSILYVRLRVAAGRCAL